jgi:hypothetical protein
MDGVKTLLARARITVRGAAGTRALLGRGVVDLVARAGAASLEGVEEA